MPAADVFWISLEEMQNLLKGLAELDVPWNDSATPRKFEKELDEHPLLPEMPYKTPQPIGKGMEIDVSCDAGSAETDLAPERICDSMERLDSTLQTPTAVFFFRSYRDLWGCKVPGFDVHGSLPQSITGTEAAILVNLVPVVTDLRSKGAMVDWEYQSNIDIPEINARDYDFFLFYKGSAKAKGSAVIGRFAVNMHTADVWDVNSKQMVRSREIDDVQTVLRREHSITAWWVEQYRNRPLEDEGK
jgi:hypothetical protein